MIVVGIDPGVTGAVAALNGEDGNVLFVEDTPTFSGKGKGREYDTYAMYEMLYTRGYSYSTLHVFIEEQAPRPHQDIRSTFKVAVGFGLWLGIVASGRSKCTIVRPQTWQKEMYTGSNAEGKERSLLEASRLWPAIEIPKTRHDRADALLIAEYGRRVLAGKAWRDVT